jgi:hypothetical protein
MQDRTILEWFCSVVDPELRGKMIENLVNHPIDPHWTVVKSVAHAIDRGFYFSPTPEGAIFWSGTYHMGIIPTYPRPDAKLLAETLERLKNK